MLNYLKRFSLRRAKSFDTVATKLLVLVLFTTIIPLYVITDLSISIVTETPPEINDTQVVEPANNLKLEVLDKKLAQKKGNIAKVRYIISLSIISLFVAIGFAIFFSRKITSPIMILLKAAGELASGNLNYRIKVKGNDEIATLSRSFNFMAQNLKQQQQLRENFVATLTHDLKVPMLAENKTVEYLLKGTYGDINEEQKEVLALIKSTNNSSLEMVSTLLDVYKYDMGSINLYKTEFNILELLTESINEIRSLALEKKVEVDVVSNEDFIEVYADKKELKRVLHNLISNAINNGIYLGHIKCEVEKVTTSYYYGPKSYKYDSSSLKDTISIENAVIISIIDDGVGIKKEDMIQLFKRFSLGSGRKPAGAGLGLFYSKQVLESHNGLIWAESTEGKGSKFSFVLPLK